MLELANLGAAVLHPRAVEYAKHNQVKLVVRSSFNHNEGTVVKEETSMEQGVVVSGIAFDKNVARISILGVADTPGVLAQVFGELAKESIDVDIIVQSGVQNGEADFSFTVSLADRERALSVIEHIRGKLPYRDVTSEDHLVKVSIVGAGMVSHPGVAAQMFDVISQRGSASKWSARPRSRYPASSRKQSRRSGAGASYRVRTGYGSAGFRRRTAGSPITGFNRHHRY